MFSTFAYSYTKNTERGDSSPLFLFIENLEEEKKIRDLAEKAIEGFDDLFLVDIKVKGNSGNQKVLIFIDGDNGISIDQCSKISREIGNEIEEEDFIADKYTLEVSSPGLDFPIILRRQYVKNVGREIEVEMNSGKKAEGKLSDVTEETIVLIFNNESQSLKFEEIKQSKVKVSFK